MPSKAERSASTRKQYEWAAARLIAALGQARLSGLSARRVQTYHEGLRVEGLSSRSRRVIGKVLDMALADAVKRGYLSRNVADAVALPSGERQGEIQIWSRAESFWVAVTRWLRGDARW